jgi:hypothetical protein
MFAKVTGHLPDTEDSFADAQAPVGDNVPTLLVVQADNREVDHGNDIITVQEECRNQRETMG